MAFLINHLVDSRRIGHVLVSRLHHSGLRFVQWDDKDQGAPLVNCSYRLLLLGVECCMWQADRQAKFRSTSG